MTESVDPRFNLSAATSPQPVTGRTPEPTMPAPAMPAPATSPPQYPEETSLEEAPPEAPPSQEVAVMGQLTKIVHELYQGQQLRAWEVVDGAINKLRNLHLELHRNLAPEGEQPSDRASQRHPMTDEEWDKHLASKEKAVDRELVAEDEKAKKQG